MAGGRLPMSAGLAHQPGPLRHKLFTRTAAGVALACAGLSILFRAGSAGSTGAPTGCLTGLSRL